VVWEIPQSATKALGLSRAPLRPAHKRQKTLEGLQVADLDNIAHIVRVLAPLEDRKTGLPRAPTICPR